MADLKLPLTPNPYSRPQYRLNDVKAVVIHWYANPGTSARANRNFFENRKSGKSGYGSAHYLVDKVDEINAVPEDEMAYHVGSTVYTASALRNLSSYPNNCTIGIEMAHDDWTGKPSKETYARTVKLAAKLLKKYGLTEKNLWTHHQVVGWKDCHRWFTNHGDEWVKFVGDVAEVLHGKRVTIPTPKPANHSDLEIVEALSQGDKGAAVKQLQADLNKVGYKLELDGSFGPATDKAVESFQKKYGLVVDGVVGPKTRAALEKAIKGSGEPKPKDTSNGKILVLPADADSWRIYPLNKAPVKANAIGSLNPKKFGGLKYEIIDNPQLNVYTIKTSDFGKVNIYAAPSTGAKITSGEVKAAPKKAAAKSEYLVLPKTADSWRVYPLGKTPVKGNEKGFLNPKKFGGLEYKILAKPQSHVYTIQTENFGKVNIYASSSTGAKIIKK